MRGLNLKKQIGLIIGFLPLFAFSLLAKFLPSGHIGFAGLVAALLALAVMLTSRPVWPPQLLNASSSPVPRFSRTRLQLGEARPLDGRPGWIWAGVAIIIGVVMLVLVLVIPFTEQYAEKAFPGRNGGRRPSSACQLWPEPGRGASVVVIGLFRRAAAAARRDSSAQPRPKSCSGAAVPLIIIESMRRSSPRAIQSASTRASA